MADSQNYGDDPSAKELINPAPFSNLKFDISTFDTPISKERLIQLFSTLPVPKLPNDVADFCFERASEATRTPNLATFNNFRDVTNDYFDAVDTGRESQWRAAYLGDSGLHETWGSSWGH